MSALVVRARRPESLQDVRRDLSEAFLSIQKGIGEGETVLVVVAAEDLLGHRGPVLGAYVGALVGMVRAIAFEGIKPGWIINALAVPAGREVSDDEAARAAGAQGLSGQVITLGTALVGKVAP